MTNPAPAIYVDANIIGDLLRRFRDTGLDRQTVSLFAWWWLGTYTDYPVFLHKDMTGNINVAVGDAVAHHMRGRGIEGSYAFLDDQIDFRNNIIANGGIYNRNWGQTCR